MKVKQEHERADLTLNIQKSKVMSTGSITSWQIHGEKMENSGRFYFLGLQRNVDDDWSHEIKRLLLLTKKAMTREHIKKQRHHFADKGPYSQSYCFSSSHVWMWELDHKEGWAMKNWCFQIVVLEKTLESPLVCKEIKSVKGNQPWIFTGRTEAEAEAPILWPRDAKS